MKLLLGAFFPSNQGPCDQHLRPDCGAAERLQESGGNHRYQVFVSFDPKIMFHTNLTA